MLECPQCGEVFKRKGHLTPREALSLHWELTHRRVRNPIPNRVDRAYAAFHGAAPIRERKIRFSLPKRFWKLGKCTRVLYAPDKPSKHSKVEFQHKFGDYGYKFDDTHIPILAASDDGNVLLIIRDKSKFKVTNRGIVG